MSDRFPTGLTKIFPIVGHPIEQVRSPAAVSEIFAARGENAICIPMHVATDDFAALLSSLRTVKNTGGILVTVPHKHAVLAYCEAATDRARFVGSVNVVRRTETGWYGDNTDGAGYLDGIARHGFSVEGKRALLVGCGGAGAAIALEMMVRGVGKLAIYDVDVPRRDKVIGTLAQRFPGRVVVGSPDPAGFDLIGNATPMGMKASDPMPFDVSALRPEQFVACVVTKPESPPLIEVARRLGCPTMAGIEMFDAQADTLADFLLGVKSPAQGSTEEGKSQLNYVS